MTDEQKKTRIAIAALVVHAVVTVVTLRDLAHRPDGQIRGPRKLWKLWATGNTSGSIAYWVFGRRRGGAPVTPEGS